MSREPNKDDVALAFLISVVSSPIGGAAGFGIGSMLFDSWLKSFGLCSLFAVFTPVFVFIAIGLMKPWNWKS